MIQIIFCDVCKDYHYINNNPHNKEDNMNKLDSLIAQADRLNKAIDAELELRAKYGEDDYENDSVIAFEYKFTGGSRWYSYAGIKVNDVWYITGPQAAGRPFTWDELVDFWNRGTRRNAFYVTAWEEM